MPFVVAFASADRVAASYKKPVYLGLITFADTFSGVISRILNTWLLTFNISYELNFIMNSFFMLIGLIGCAFSKTFWLTFLSIFFIGYSAYLGESILLGYIAFRKKNTLLKSWSCGSGMAGMSGACYSFLAKYFSISLFWTFISLSPLVIFYFCFFIFIIRKSPDEYDKTNQIPLMNQEGNIDETIIDNQKQSFLKLIDNNKSDNSNNTNDNNNSNDNNTNDNSNNSNDNNTNDNNTNDNNTNDNNTNDDNSEDKNSGEKITEIHEFIQNKEDERVPLCNPILFRLSWGYFVNCGLVYFFEYCIISVFSHCATDAKAATKYPYIYSFLNLFYQVGVFLSRSSIIFFKFPWVSLLTLLQCGLFILWFLNSFIKFLSFGAMIPLMIFVGLNGGGSYVNVFNLIMESNMLTVKEKELTTNWNAFFISVFIILASIFTFISENTFLKNYINGSNELTS